MSATIPVAKRMERERREREGLTPEGWPRPFGDYKDGARLPVPWIVSPPEWAAMVPAREKACVYGCVCQVCGEGHDPGERVVIFQSGKLRDQDTGGELEYGTPFTDAKVLLVALDNGVLHERCAKLAVGFCPHLKKAHAEGRLCAFTVPRADLKIERRARGGQITALGDHAKSWAPR